LETIGGRHLGTSNRRCPVDR